MIHLHYEKRYRPCQGKMCEMALAAHQLHGRQTDIAWHVEIDESFFAIYSLLTFLSLKWLPKRLESYFRSKAFASVFLAQALRKK